MSKLYFCVFEPLKYSWKLFPVQIAIQIRTWRKATHVGMLWASSTEVEHLLEFIRGRVSEGFSTIKQNELEEKKLVTAGTLISATWPKVKLQNIFRDYQKDRVYIRSVEIPPAIEAWVRSEWKKRLNKEGYSIGGLIWFLVGPIFNIFNRKLNDPDLRHEFCSEAATNVLYSAGIPVFTFDTDWLEEIKLKIRRAVILGENVDEKLTDWEKAVIALAGYTLGSFEKKKLIPRGYKISPGVFKINPLFKTEAVLEIWKDKIVITP